MSVHVEVRLPWESPSEGSMVWTPWAGDVRTFRFCASGFAGGRGHCVGRPQQWVSQGDEVKGCLGQEFGGAMLRVPPGLGLLMVA